ncbi:unnamed protein product, partial [Linum tenue]
LLCSVSFVSISWKPIEKEKPNKRKQGTLNQVVSRFSCRSFYSLLHVQCTVSSPLDRDEQRARW